LNKKIVQKVKYQDDTTEKTRLDAFVMHVFEVTRSQAQKLIKEGLVLLNNKLEKPKYLLEAGDEVVLMKETPKQKFVIPIIHEDKDLLVINKPAGVSAHPAPGEKELTVTEYFKNKLKFETDDERNGVVHRLDKGTSGVMILAKNEKAQETLKKLFKNRKVEKTYLAVIEGHMEPKAGTINIAIERDQKHREKMTVSKAGKEAVTEFATINIYDKYSLLKLNPKTGRTHQIRVHLSALGHPIVGDLRYGKASKLIGRIFLHAEKAELKYPGRKERLTFEAELPKELKEVLRQLN
jgi:23S rRNA pseudouridine1911/1915/1917 synthase